MHLREFLSFLVSMLAITNPPGSLAVFLGMTAERPEERQQIAILSSITAFIVLLLVTWAGVPLLSLFGISLPAFQITGGLIILLRALTMLRSDQTPTSITAKEVGQEIQKDAIAVVPLGIPIIAGPGAMTNTIIFSHVYSSITNKICISLGVLLISLVIGLVLFFSTHIGRFIGETGIKTITRIMGLILAAIAMSMITTGLSAVFPAWSWSQSQSSHSTMLGINR